MSRNLFADLVLEAIRDPQRNGQRIASWPMPGTALWEALLLVGILSTLGLYGTLLLAGGPLPLLMPPLQLVVLQILAMLLLAGVMAFVGRLFGGKGDFGGALRVMIWLQTLMLVVQLAQILSMLVLPFLAGLLSLLTMIGLAWVAAGLVAGLHGFGSKLKTFVGMVAAMLAVGFVLSLLLAPFVTLTP